MRVVRIKWIDSTAQAGWHDGRDVEEFRPSLIETVGFLVCEGEDYVTVTAHNGEWEFHSAMAIPKCAIKEMIDVAT